MKLRSSLLALILFSGCLFTQCKTTPKKEESSTANTEKLAKFMEGSWETTYIKINMPSYRGSDSTHVFEDNFSNPASGKAQSSYAADGTFKAWFLQPNGEKVGETSGKYSTKNDSLFVDYHYGGQQVQAWYHIRPTETGFEGTVQYDWDKDQQFDDTLFMKTKRINTHLDSTK
jgi:hypothetical protein